MATVKIVDYWKSKNYKSKEAKHYRELLKLIEYFNEYPASCCDLGAACYLKIYVDHFIGDELRKNTNGRLTSDLTFIYSIVVKPE